MSLVTYQAALELSDDRKLKIPHAFEHVHDRYCGHLRQYVSRRYGKTQAPVGFYYFVIISEILIHVPR